MEFRRRLWSFDLPFSDTGRTKSREREWQLVRVAGSGASIEVTDIGVAAGTTVAVEVDVACPPPGRSSVATVPLQ